MGGRGGFAGLTQREFPKPIIAAVNGSALAGGFEIMLSCDLVVAADHATFGIPEAKRGLIAGAGGLIRLPKRLPMAVALELALTGDPIDADAGLRARPGQPGRARRRVARRGAGVGRAHRRQRAAGRALLQERHEAGGRGPRGRGLEASTPRPWGSCSPRPTPWRGRSPSPRSGAPIGRASSGGGRVLAPALDTLRLTLHVLAAAVWVGGQIVMAGLVGPARRLGGRHPRRWPGPSPAWPGRPTPSWWSRASGTSPPSTGPTRAPPGRRCWWPRSSWWPWPGWLPSSTSGPPPRPSWPLWGSVAGLASIAALAMGVLLAGLTPNPPGDTRRAGGADVRAPRRGIGSNLGSRSPPRGPG